MRFHRHDSDSLTAFGLLVVFVLGVLLVPTLHRVQHGVAWAELRGEAATAEGCDHARHGDGFEAHIPAFHEDLCALCHRHDVSVDGPSSHATALLSFGVYGATAASWLFSAPASSLLIRGPPVLYVTAA
jgi:hypothetical protein